MIIPGSDDWPTEVDHIIVPCSPLRPELQNEETIDEVCNEAFDELLTQEFNPDQDDFEDDVVSEPDTNKDAGKCLLRYFMYAFLPLHFGSHLE